MKKPISQKEALIPQARLLKLFQIIAVLKSGHFTVKQLAQRFNASERTIYRYINLLQEADFLIEQDFHNRYFIVTSDDDPLHAQFTIEETKMIQNLIQGGSFDNPLRQSLLKKLSLNSEIDSMPRLFVKAHLSRLVEELAEAIKNKKQVVLKGYHSANSNDIRDRLVEPIHFGDEYQSIMALDTEDKVCKQFKIDRITEVLELDETFAFEELHQSRPTDIFGFTGDASTWITLEMGMRAYLLLREEFPLATAYLKKEDHGYAFHGPVASFEGVGRFVLGLIDEIEIKSPPAFIDYVRSKIGKLKVSG
jgi:predicted DNA-binding transcriptional regulator YafY